MHEVIICEKPSSAEKIAKALSPSAKKKVYNKCRTPLLTDSQKTEIQSFI